MLEEQLEQKFKVIPVIIQTLGVVNPPPKKRKNRSGSNSFQAQRQKSAEPEKADILHQRNIKQFAPPKISLMCFVWTISLEAFGE